MTTPRARRDTAHLTNYAMCVCLLRPISPHKRRVSKLVRPLTFELRRNSLSPTTRAHLPLSAADMMDWMGAGQFGPGQGAAPGLAGISVDRG